MKITADGRLHIPEEILDEVGTTNSEVSIEVEGTELHIRSVHSSAPKTESRQFSLKNQPFVGMWSDREQMTDSAAWVRRLRRKQWLTP